MKIIRNRQEFELTADELFNAYKEQQYIFDIENIKYNMENYLDELEYDLLNDNEEFIEAAAEQLRRNQNKYDMDFDDALKDAFEMVKPKYLK